MWTQLRQPLLSKMVTPPLLPETVTLNCHLLLVRMMGTEGRIPGKEITPTDEIYDMVVFKSIDIEDLSIFEPAPPLPPPQPRQPFIDPAIVSRGNATNAAGASSTTSGMVGGDAEVSAGGWPAAPRLQFGTATPVTPRIAPPVATAIAPSATTLPTPPKPSFGSLNNWNAPQAPKPAPTIKNDAAPQRANFAAETNNTAITKGNLVSGNKGGEKVLTYSTGTGRMEMVPREGRSYASVLNENGQSSFSGPRPPRQERPLGRPVPNTEFNFEESNAKLAQNPQLIELVTKSSEEQKVYYDKASSFFDNISSDAAAGNKDTSNLPNERKWNIETFGVAHAYRGSYRGGRGGYYRGGRGGARHHSSGSNGHTHPLGNQHQKSAPEL